ncbi:MAG: hypothetical protein EOP82_24770 [Variovorax sp.]|nr:MAG: hypothetical protein EOP82_24770 [Variovorax sp.]
MRFCDSMGFRRGLLPSGALICAALLFCAHPTYANYPCSGSKGGVAHCAGAKFVCNDGSIRARSLAVRGSCRERGTTRARIKPIVMENSAGPLGTES